MNYKDEIGHLLREYFLRTITEEEQYFLDCWLEESEEHRLLFERLRKDTRFAEEYGVFRETDAERAWETFCVKNRIGRKRRVLFTWREYVAAVIVLPLVIAGAWLLLSPKEMKKEMPVVQRLEPMGRGVILEVVGGESMVLAKEQEKMIKVGNGVAVLQNARGLIYSDTVQRQKVDTNVLRIPRGGEFTLQLADGTKVYLNSATELRYPVAFVGQDRRVYLRGEAYFEVAKDAEHPFIVIADDVQVKVYGTSFNVNTHSHDGIRTVLVEGTVGIKGRVSDEEYMMKPNEMAFYNRASCEMEVKEVNPDLYTLWRKGVLVFERESLENIMNTLSLWYDMEIFFQSESVKSLHFSGHMKRYEQIEDILHAITDATGVVFTINGRTVCVSR